MAPTVPLARGVAAAFAAGAASASLALLLWRRRDKKNGPGVTQQLADGASASTALVAAGGAGAAGTPLAERLAAIADPRYHALPGFVDGGPAALPRPVRRRFHGASDYSRTGGTYVYRIVLTGGPSGGRSTAMRRLARAVKTRGLDVYCCPAVPTILINGGARPPAASAGGGSQIFDFETGLMQLQLQMERSFIKIAQATGRPSIVVMDRGLLDVAAYVSPDHWASIMATLGYDQNYIKGRYDMVLHLVTAADGAEEHFTSLANARRDSFDEPPAEISPDELARTRDASLAAARALDARLRDAWSGHPRVREVDNGFETFDAKIARAVDHVLESVEPRGLQSLTMGVAPPMPMGIAPHGGFR